MLYWQIEKLDVGRPRLPVMMAFALGPVSRF
jgi:hypothetical protein